MVDNRAKKWIYLNNEIMVKKGEDFQLEKDKEAVYSYFVDYVNKNTVFFHNLEEKMRYLIKMTIISIFIKCIVMMKLKSF